MVFPVVGGDGKPTGYEISNSLRFNDDDSPKVSRSISSSGSARNATLSVWVKRGNLGTRQQIYSNKTASSGFSGMNVYFYTDDKLYIDHHDGSNNKSLYTTQVFRDVSAWYHIVHAIDTTTGTATNRLRLYVNGTEVTDFGTDQNPSQNADLALSNSTGDQSIGDDPRDNNDLFDGYMAEYNFVDGTTLDPTYFGETNDNGVWIPKKPDVSSYGTNGFYLQFKQTGTSANSSGIGADTSGNDNHMSVTNLAATDVTTDTPTNNFATLNPLQTITYPTLAEGNLVQTGHSSSDSAGIGATIMPASGKWYAEAKVPNISSASEGYPHFGITDTSLLSTRGTQGTKIAAGFKINDAASVTNTNILGTTTLTNTNWPSWSNNDIINFALDLDNRKLYIGKNGTYINSGDPAAGSNHQITWANSTEISLILAGYSVSSGSGGGGDDTSWNYGNPAFSISSGNADANGYGNFEYAPPSGYYAICTKNLAEYG